MLRLPFKAVLGNSYQFPVCHPLQWAYSFGNIAFAFRNLIIVVVKRSYVFDAMSTLYMNMCTIYKKMVSTIFNVSEMHYIYGVTDSREILILNLV